MFWPGARGLGWILPSAFSEVESAGEAGLLPPRFCSRRCPSSSRCSGVRAASRDLMSFADDMDSVRPTSKYGFAGQKKFGPLPRIFHPVPAKFASRKFLDVNLGLELHFQGQPDERART
jgi:hypothetical protein